MKYKVGDRLTNSDNEIRIEDIAGFNYLIRFLDGSSSSYPEDYLSSFDYTLIEEDKGLKDDLVNQPPHYKQGKYECIDVIEDWKLPFHEANAIKYICRAPHKGTEIIDLEKAIFYLKRKVNKLKEESKI